MIIIYTLESRPMYASLYWSHLSCINLRIYSDLTTIRPIIFFNLFMLCIYILKRWLMYSLLCWFYFIHIDLRIYCDLTTIRSKEISYSSYITYLYTGASADVQFLVLILFLMHRSEDLLWSDNDQTRSDFPIFLYYIFIYWSVGRCTVYCTDPISYT